MQVVLGAGLSGLSLAVALVRAGVRDDVVVVDRRTTFGRDRTWATWSAPGTPFEDLARRRWATWEVRTAGRRASGRSRRRPYLAIDGADLYAAALDELDRAPQVDLRLGSRVLDVGDGWAETDAGRLEGHVHDGLGLASPALRGRRPGRTELWQAFLGWEVETERPVFSPGVATLMDFRCPQDGQVRFVYVLPHGRHRALVEHTVFAPSVPSAAEHRAALEAHLGETLAAGSWEAGHEERGRVLMTTGSLPARRGTRTTAIGVAGGAVRASSGYAFSRTQAHVTAIAEAVAAGRPPPARAGAPHRALLDAVFLQALTTDPAAAGDRFATLVKRVPGEAFARFMTDQSTRADETRVVAALPPLPHALAALRTLAGSLR